jgi:hypothetical protein
MEIVMYKGYVHKINNTSSINNILYTPFSSKFNLFREFTKGMPPTLMAHMKISRFQRFSGPDGRRNRTPTPVLESNPGPLGSRRIEYEGGKKEN